MTHICLSKLIIIGSDNGLSSSRRLAIDHTNATILLIGPLGTKFYENLIEINTFSFKKMHNGPHKIALGPRSKVIPPPPPPLNLMRQGDTYMPQ